MFQSLGLYEIFCKLIAGVYYMAYQKYGRLTANQIAICTIHLSVLIKITRNLLFSRIAIYSIWNERIIFFLKKNSPAHFSLDFSFYIFVCVHVIRFSSIAFLNYASNFNRFCSTYPFETRAMDLSDENIHNKMQ